MSVELIFCPLCGEVIHRHLRTHVATSVRVPSRTNESTAVWAELARRAQLEQRQEHMVAENACAHHYSTKHRLRFKLWQRFNKPWLINWPQRHKMAPLPEQQIFEPLTFLSRLRKR